MVPPAKKRATQDRAEATKEKLLAATLAVILRDGWSGTSTLKICEEAKVSNGAQTHHYPKKSDLLIAALEHNRDNLQSETDQRLGRRNKKPSTVSELLDVLRLTKRDESYFYATVESLIAARTDGALREDLQDLDNEWIRSLRETSSERAEGIESSLPIEDLMELTIIFVRGMVVQRGAHQNTKHLDKMFALWCDIVERATKKENE